MEMLKRELLLKDEQDRHLENEMKLIKIENESIKREKEVLCDQVRQFAETLEREIDDMRHSDEWNIAMATAVTGAVATNRDEMEPVRDYIRSIRDQFDRMKCQMESIRLDVWLIEDDMSKIRWDWQCLNKTSGKFGGGERSYTFELASRNSLCLRSKLDIYLRIWHSPIDSLLQWPFRGAVTVTVANRDRREACVRMTEPELQIERPSDNRYNCSHTFEFQHYALRRARVDLERGIRVWCQIVPVRAHDAVSQSVILSPIPSA